MANEISLRTKLEWTVRGCSMSCEVSETVNQTGTRAIESVQVIGGSSETISVGDATGYGYRLFKNLATSWANLTDAQKVGYTDKDDYDAKNSVFIGRTSPVSNSVYNFKLKPQSGTSLSAEIPFYAIRSGTTDVPLLVVAIQE